MTERPSVSVGVGSCRRSHDSVLVARVMLVFILVGLAPWTALGRDLASAPPNHGGTSSATSSNISDPAPHDPDPWQKMNRGVFWVNEKGDIYLVAPAARVWKWVTPGFFQTAVTNVNRLILMPAVFANDILQLKPTYAGDDFLRIFFNASFGLAGLIDVATMVDIPQHDEDFGQTLGYWGVPSGPYLMLPLFGPATVRDGVGRVADAGATFYFSLLPFWGTVIIRGVDLLNLRARYLDEVDQSRAEAFDYYAFMRDAYLQNRRMKVGRARGEKEQLELDDDLYYFDDEEAEFEQVDEEVERRIESESNP